MRINDNGIMQIVNNLLPETYVFNQPYETLQELLQSENYSQVFLLVDKQTEIHCLPMFKKNVPDLSIACVFTVESGEMSKSFDTCKQLWKQLADNNADRHSLLINLGGGMITDLGGFIASTFKRGIDFINIPTTLLAMVDASIGGKTGVNLDGLKNQIGVIRQAKLVLYDFDYLTTLPDNEVKSGFAEMLKHGLIADKEYWNKLISIKDITGNSLLVVQGSVKIKSQLVDEDPNEHSVRKHLNFGHTLGHAIESYTHMNWQKPLLHGEAIAHGIILESYLSHYILGLEKEDLSQIIKTIKSHFVIHHFDAEQQKNIIDLLRHDKKNRDGKVLFVLLSEIGQAKTDVEINEEIITESFSYLS